jgi:hypothetical protein
VNHDATADILWRHSTPGVYAAWLMSSGAVGDAVSFGAASDWTLSGFGDVDGHGSDDIVWRSSSTGALAIWFMSGRVVVRTAVFGVGGGGTSSALATSAAMARRIWCFARSSTEPWGCG